MMIDREKLRKSSGTYNVSPTQLRDLGVEIFERTRDNAYGGSPDYQHMTQEERRQIYDQLKEQIRTKGFNDKYPITIMLLRKEGKRDGILDGHHRLNIAIELGITTIPVRFVYEMGNSVF